MPLVNDYPYKPRTKKSGRRSRHSISAWVDDPYHGSTFYSRGPINNDFQREKRLKRPVYFTFRIKTKNMKFL